MSRRRSAVDQRPLERGVESSLVRHSEARGVIPKKMGLEGWPDRMLLAPGGHVRFVELKREGEEPEPLQLWVHEQLRARGFQVDVIDRAEQVAELFERWPPRSR